MKLYEVGGCVRDELLGLKSKDIDFAVEAESYEAMREEMEARGFEIYLETPEYFTIRAHFPKDHENYGKVAADFVLCRKEGEYSDGRRPDSVEVGTIYDDLARRDFTINAIAKTVDGEYIDPYDGRKHLMERDLHCVGSAKERFTEDALRALRAMRFNLTKQLLPDDDILEAFYSTWLLPLIEAISIDRKRDELTKMFHHSTYETLTVLNAIPPALLVRIIPDEMWLKPTTEK